MVRGQLVQPETPIHHKGQAAPVAVPLRAVPRAAGEGDLDQLLHPGVQWIEGAQAVIRLPELTQADVVRAPLGDGDFQLLLEGLLEKGDVLQQKLLLKRDGARGDHGLFAALQEGDQIAE